MERLTLDEAIKYIKEVVQKNRKNKEKNTIIIPNSFISSNDCADKYGQVAKWLEELKSYKDLEEQDLLVRLPCKVGTEVYYILGIPNKTPCAIDKCVFKLSDINKIGKTVFLTREEAEKKLEELKNEI
nr:MAG TPA: hypothetical protein [Caudoviricetes sp.]